MTSAPAFDARTEVRAAVYRMTGGLGDPRSAVHDPLAALAALRHIRAAAAQSERDAARRAREEGRTWHEIGEALGYADDPQPGMTSVAERAFARLASDLGDAPSFMWRCLSCGAPIRDHGPGIPLPDDQRGHADGCERRATEIEAGDRQRDDAERGEDNFAQNRRAEPGPKEAAGG